MTDSRSRDTRNFDEVAGEYDESLPAHVVAHYLDKRAAFVAARFPPPCRVLDVGCGTGVLAERLHRMGYAVSGVDASAGMLERLRRRAPEVAATHASATALPFGDGEFDLVLTVATLHHIAEPAAVHSALREMVRVVSPGGHVIVWDHNPRNPYWPYLMRRVPQDTGEERLIPAAEVSSGLAAAGAVVESAQELGLVPDFTPRWALGLAKAVERRAERTPMARRLCAHNVVVARAPTARESRP